MWSFPLERMGFQWIKERVSTVREKTRNLTLNRVSAYVGAQQQISLPT
jgi:hypothetical protein